MLRELIPSDLTKLQNANEWKRLIVAAYNQDGGMSPEDAKVTFLKVVYRFEFVIKFVAFYFISTHFPFMYF